MGQKLLITEDEKNDILSLYEQGQIEYIEENKFLQKYIGKTFNIYNNSDFKNFAYTNPTRKITQIKYNGIDGIEIKAEGMINDKNISFIYNVWCEQNPDKLGYRFAESNTGRTLFNKTLIDNIIQQGVSSGFSWCQKPKADFGMKSGDKKTNNIV